MHHYQTNYSILERSIAGIQAFLYSFLDSLESHEGRCGIYVIVHHANVFFFIAEDNILWHKRGLSDNTDSFENLSLGCKID